MSQEESVGQGVQELNRSSIVRGENDGTVDVHRAYFHTQAKPNTYVEVPAWHDEVEKVMREVNFNPGASSPRVFHRSHVDGSGLLPADDFVNVMRPWHTQEIEKHLRSNWDVEVQTVGPGDDGKQVR